MKNFIKELKRKDHPHVLEDWIFSSILGRDYSSPWALLIRETGQVTSPRALNTAMLCYGL